MIALSLWESHDQAEEAVRFAAAWVQENIAGLVESVQNHVGDLAFFNSTALVGS